MALGWWPLEHAWQGRWLLRASEGFTGRGNSALPLGDPGLDLSGAVDRVEAYYVERALPSRFAVPRMLAPDAEQPHHRLSAELDVRGYEVHTETRVLVAAPSRVAADSRATLLPEPDEDWLGLYHYRGEPTPSAGRRLLVGVDHVRFAAVREGAATVAVGRIALARGWGGVTAMEVAGSHRRQGLAREVLAALAAYARDAGATGLYLQVSADNTGARRLYASAGFTEHHGYHYRIR